MKKVVIVGAGPAGLSAAYQLLKKSKDYEVIILEKDSQVGGISKTVKYKGNRLDIGGHRFFTKSRDVENLWTTILPIQGKKAYDDKILKRNLKLKRGGPNPEKDDKVLLIRNRVSRIYYENKFYDYPVSINFSTIRNLGIIRTIKAGFSYIRYQIKSKEEKNLEDFYINRFGKKLYSMFFEGYTKKVWGRDPKNISKDWGYQRVKGISIRAVIKDYFYRFFHLKNKEKETSLIESFYYPKYGPGELYEELAHIVKKMGATIIKKSEVIKINKKNNKIESIVYKKADKEYIENLDILISSMPLKDLVEILNNKPKAILDIATNLPYRDFITVGILVPKLSIKNKTKIKTLNNNIPDCWLYIQDKNVKMGRIQIFNNWSPYMVKDIKNTMWIGLEYFCLENDDFWNMSSKKLKKYAEEELRRMGIIDCEVLDSCCIKVKKAYPAYFDSYKDIDKLINYLNSISNLYCIGRNGQHRYNNMDHSIMTAFKAVESILDNFNNKDDVWNINIDNNYHERRSK